MGELIGCRLEMIFVLGRLLLAVGRAAIRLRR